jgi:zinc protease
VFVEQAGAVQSVLRIGTLGPARTDAAFMPANVAGTLVGGMFSSRINMNLREEHGWSYGAYGGFSEARDFGAFVVRTQVQADKTAESVVEVLKELDAARGKAPTAAELALTQDNLLKSLPGNFETNGATAGSFLAIPQFGAGPDLWARDVAEVKAVDASVAQKAAETWFAKDRMLIVVCGPRTVEVDDGAGGKRSVDVVAALKALPYEYVER